MSAMPADATGMQLAGTFSASRVGGIATVGPRAGLGRHLRTSLADEEREYDRDALAVAEGKQYRAKQDFLYVRLAADAGFASLPRA